MQFQQLITHVLNSQHCCRFMYFCRPHWLSTSPPKSREISERTKIYPLTAQQYCCDSRKSWLLHNFKVIMKNFNIFQKKAFAHALQDDRQWPEMLNLFSFHRVCLTCSEFPVFSVFLTFPLYHFVHRQI